MRQLKRALIVGLIVATSHRGRLEASDSPPQASPSPAPGLGRGDVVPAFEAEGVDGVVRRVDYAAGSATVLLFFQSGCPKCQRMIPLWNRANEQRPKAVQVYGVMLDQEPPGFFTMMPVSFPVLRAGRTPAERRALVESFKVHGVPLTVRILRGGKVDDVAEGPIDSIRVGAFFAP